MNKIKICGKEYEITYNIAAMSRIEKRCGKIEKLNDWISGGESSETLKKMCYVAGDMINGAIKAHNSRVALGLESGEKKEYLSEELISAIPEILSINEIRDIESVLIDTINGAENADIPADETDPDLADVESEKKR